MAAVEPKAWESFSGEADSEQPAKKAKGALRCALCGQTATEVTGLLRKCVSQPPRASLSSFPLTGAQ